MESNKNFNTFWGLINTHRIEIPIIQRDYAQGRNDAKATQIREGFIKDIVSNLQKKTPLHLDFVYGKVGGKTDIVKIENNKKAISNLLKSVQSYSDNLDISFTYKLNDHNKSIEQENHTFFIPLDGQQRLTTLYLIHWYLTSRLNLKVNNIYDNFTYRTRKSSKEFCKALTLNVFKIDSKKIMTSQITDTSWFFSNWKKDPTVRSMLTVLDEIHLNLKDYDSEDLMLMWKGLTELDIITFEFLDLDKFELTDELYVKMNARGKHLTDFENFKAWLQDYVKENEIEVETSDWHKKLDIEWTDLFWKFKESGKYEIDKEYLTFFNLMSLFFFTENTKIENNKIDEESKEIIDKFRNSDFISQTIYEKYDCFKKENINKIFSVLNTLQEKGYNSVENKIGPLYNLDENNLIKKLFGSENSTINLPDRTYLYALIKFLNLKNKNVTDYDEVDNYEFFTWMRVCKNLVYNAYIFNPETFVNAIKSLEKLSQNCLNIYEYLCSENAEISFFTTVQKNEEILKAKLIIDNKNWEIHFVEFEKHPYFNGQIDFILEISKKDEEVYDIELFIENSKKSAAIFYPTILNSDLFLFQRALLSKKNYFLQVGSNLNFCSNNNSLRDKEENWRRVLRNPEKLEIYKKLLDEIEVGNEIKDLNSIINNYTSDKWKKYFVKSPEPFKCCDSNLIRFYNEENILLFKTSRAYGSHAELRTYTFYCNHINDKINNFKPFQKEFYWYNPRNENHPCFVLHDFEYDKKKYKIDVFYISEDKVFEVDFYSEFRKKIDERIIDNLKTIGFELIDNHLYSHTKTDSESELLKIINNISKILMSL